MMTGGKKPTISKIRLLNDVKNEITYVPEQFFVPVQFFGNILQEKFQHSFLRGEDLRRVP